MSIPVFAIVIWFAFWIFIYARTILSGFRVKKEIEKRRKEYEKSKDEK